MTENGCQHFMAFKEEFGLKSFTLEHGCFAVCVTDEARKRKVYNSPSLFFPISTKIIPILLFK